MSGSSAVEIDFFRLNGESSAIPSPPKRLSDRRDIQGVISKINPELLKTAIASASADKNSVANKSCSVPSSHQEPQIASPALPVYNQDGRGINTATSSAPLTIFYNGIVSVFDVSCNQAENIMKLVEGGSSGSKAVEPTDVKPVPSPRHQNPAIGGVINKDLPLSRKKSLKRFLEKRKERQVSGSPYAHPLENAFLR